MEVFRTEFNFVLPGGYLDRTGQLQKEGTMRLATAADEILPMRDPRVQRNTAYLPIILLSRVVTRLGSIDIMNTDVIENLFSADFAYLQDMYNRINGFGGNTMAATCPSCEHEFELNPDSAESSSHGDVRTDSHGESYNGSAAPALAGASSRGEL